jgi:hybrid cluster-associated redox disulfide protein
MEQKISKDMTFGELIRSYPDTVSILGNYGLHCIGCHLSIYETIEQGMKAHGLDGAALEKLINELNKKAGK